MFTFIKNLYDIQLFLDDLPYSTDSFYRCPQRVLQDRKAHCFDGAVFAAAALRHLGYPPLILNLFAERDDDHLLALFKQDGLWGAIGKSNFVGLRFREPIHRSLRELVMTYFENYYNIEGEKTLRSYTRPLNLSQFDALDWLHNDEAMEVIADRLDQLPTFQLLSIQSLQRLHPMDRRSYEAGMWGTDPEGLYQPVKT